MKGIQKNNKKQARILAEIGMNRLLEDERMLLPTCFSMISSMKRGAWSPESRTTYSIFSLLAYAQSLAVNFSIQEHLIIGTLPNQYHWHKR